MWKHYSFSRISKTVSVFLGIFLLVSTSMAAFPQNANAQLFGFSIVDDPLDIVQNTFTSISTTLTQVQNSVLNPIAWTIAKAALQSIVKSAVNSANKGPNGTPAYATNLNSTLQAVSDTAANGFISQLSSNGSIKSPFQTAVASAASNQYLQSSGSNGFFASNPYTLNQVTSNDTAFLNGNFSQGGLTAWMSAWSNPANNPFGASQLAADGLNSSVANAQSVQKAELNWGQGFTASRGTCNTTTTGGSSVVSTLTSLVSLASNSTCQSSAVKTPGSTIKSSLDKSLGSGIDSMVNAHNFEEIVGSLLGQLIGQVFNSGGLAGTSQTTATAATTATTPATATTYFDQTDPTEDTLNDTLTTQFSSTISNEITQVQGFNSDWSTINNEALAAQAALTNNACYPNAQETLTSEVQPVISQAATSLAEGNTGVSNLENLQAQLSQVASSSDPTDALSTVSSNYTNLQASLPSATDISYAATQSLDNSASTTTPPTVYTQMKEIVTTVQACVVPSI